MKLFLHARVQCQNWHFLKRIDRRWMKLHKGTLACTNKELMQHQHLMHMLSNEIFIDFAIDDINQKCFYTTQL